MPTRHPEKCVQEGLPDLVDLAFVESKTGKVPIGIHPGKAVDERSPGEVKVFDFDPREQALLLGLSQ